MHTKRLTLLAPLAAALTLAACGGGSEEEQQPANMTAVEEVGAPANMTEVPVEAPPATRIDNANTESLPEAAPLAADEQTQEDADATGMTARISRDEGDNDSQPAE